MILKNRNGQVRLLWHFILLVFVIMLIAGCRLQPGNQPSQLPPSTELEGESITDYLTENIGIAGFGGKVFCAYEFLDADLQMDASVYVWALCQEYYWNQDALTSGSGISLPVALQTKSVGDKVEIIGHHIPRDGEYYGSDIREVFPRSTWPQIMPEDIDDINQYNLRANQLVEETRIQAWEFYGTAVP